MCGLDVSRSPSRSPWRSRSPRPRSPASSATCWISNGGTPVSVGTVLPGETKLDDAIQELKVGGTMQSLGTLNGVGFYATRNADGDFCFAMVRVDGQFARLRLRSERRQLPVRRRPGADVPRSRPSSGRSGGRIATVQALDANGNVLDSTPVENNSSLRRWRCRGNRCRRSAPSTRTGTSLRPSSCPGPAQPRTSRPRRGNRRTNDLIRVPWRLRITAATGAPGGGSATR